MGGQKSIDRTLFACTASPLFYFPKRLTCPWVSLVCLFIYFASLVPLWSRPSNVANHGVQLRQGVLPLLDGLLPLCLGHLQLLLELLDVALLVLLAVVEAGEYGDEVLDLLLLRDQVLGELDLGRLEYIRRVGIDYIIIGDYSYLIS